MQTLRDNLQAELNKHKLTFKVKSMVLRVGSPQALKACIFYPHTRTLAFNWSRLDTIPEAEAARIIAKLKLPEGVKAEVVVPK